MKRIVAVSLALVACTSLSTARAAPPTVTPSPGYDARLQEQRKAAAASSFTQPAAAATKPVSRHRKRTQVR